MREQTLESAGFATAEAAIEAGFGAACWWCSLALFLAEQVGPRWLSELFSPIAWIQWFVGLFGGRPKLGPDSASDNAAISLLSAKNPVLRVYGAGIRALEAQGCPISASSGDCRTRLNALTAALSRDLIFQFGSAQGSAYFKSAVGYAFSQYCTNAPCSSVFAKDPTFSTWVNQGKLRASDGYPLWRQSAPPPAPPGAKPPAPKLPAPAGPPSPAPPPAPPPKPKPKPPAVTVVNVCGHKVNLTGSAAQQAEQERAAIALYCAQPISAQPQASLFDQAKQLVAQLKRSVLWLEIVSCFDNAEPELVIVCLEGLIARQAIEQTVLALLKTFLTIARALDTIHWRALRPWIGGSNMPCVNTHNVTSKAQGPGVCCAALSKSGQAPRVGLRIAATNKLGKCIVCEIAASTSKKHPGRLVFKRGAACDNGTCLCPSSSGGCCELTTAAA